MRKLTIEAQHNDIHILDGKDILFEDIHFKLPAGEIMVNVEGERSGNIVFKNINANQEKVEYKKESPMRISRPASPRGLIWNANDANDT